MNGVGLLGTAKSTMNIGNIDEYRHRTNQQWIHGGYNAGDISWVYVTLW